MTETTLPATTQGTDEKRQLALLKAVGLDKVAPEQRELALAIADRYGLDLMLKHLVMVEGKPFITRDGLLHIAHRSGVFDGIEVTTPEKVDRYWRATASVWRKDMSRPFVYPGRYPAGAKNDEEMGIKVAESMALRRAFDVSAPTLDERWANDEAEPVADPIPKASSLAERARLKRAAIVTEAAQDAPQDVEEAEYREVAPEPAPEAATGPCGDASPYGDGSACTKPAGHPGHHANDARESWERKA
jgi:hypothetical protein